MLYPDSSKSSREVKAEGFPIVLSKIIQRNPQRDFDKRSSGSLIRLWSHCARFGGQPSRQQWIFGGGLQRERLRLRHHQIYHSLLQLRGQRDQTLQMWKQGVLQQGPAELPFTCRVKLVRWAHHGNNWWRMLCYRDPYISERRSRQGDSVHRKDIFSAKLMAEGRGRRDRLKYFYL